MRERKAIAALLGSITLLVGISLVMAWRLDYAPDEGSHAFVVEHYAHSTEPLDSDDMRYGTLRGHAYYLLSPAPYAVYVPFQWLQDAVGPIDAARKPELLLVRLGGLVMAVAQLGVTIAIARRMFRGATALQAIALATAANLLPQLRYLHAYVNPDAMTILAGTLCFAMALRVLQRARVGLGDAALVGLTLGFAGLMRLNVAIPAVLLLLALVARLIRQQGAVRERLRYVGVPLAIAAVMAGGLHLSFYAELQNGDLVPADTVMQMGDSSDTGVVPPAPPMRELIDDRIREVPSFWMTTWLWYPRYAELRGPPLMYLFLLSMVGVVGLAIPGGRLRVTGRIVGAAAILAVVATWASVAGEWLYGQQGRFVLPAGITALTVVITSTATLVDRIPRLRHGIVLTAGLWIVGLVYLDLWSTSHLVCCL